MARSWRAVNGGHQRETRSQETNQQEIARLAYQFYEERGRQEGHDVDDWLRAEAIVRQRARHDMYAPAADR